MQDSTPAVTLRRPGFEGVYDSVVYNEAWQPVTDIHVVDIMFPIASVVRFYGTAVTHGGSGIASLPAETEDQS